MFVSEAITEGVKVAVRSQYLPQRSDPQQGFWFFIYTVRITNEGQGPVRLRSRHWVITDGNGKVQEVKGPGVVGAQPRLAPGEGFEYTSSCPLPTPVGTMHGTYQMERDDGTGFDATIAPFSLSEPLAYN